MRGRIAKLKQEKDALLAEAKALLGTADAAKREPTAEETARHDQILSRLDAISADVARIERLDAHERELIKQEIHEGAQVTVRNLAGDAPWPAFGAFLQAVRTAHSGGGIDPRLSAAASGMSEAIGPDGGYAVPVEYGGPIEKQMWDTGQILSRVSDRPIGGNAITFNVLKETSRADGSRRGGVLGYWVDEGVAPTASAISLAKIEMKLRKVAALGYMTDELMQDAPALQAELTDAFAEELQFQTENAIVNSAGAASPLGFLNAPCLISVAKETGQAAATILTTNLSKMWVRMPTRSKANSVWLINGEVNPQLDELTIPAGTAAVEPRFVTYGPGGLLTIKGRPVVEVEYCAALGTVGDICLVDLSQYRVIRKSTGVEQASSMHVRFLQGEETFRAIYRVDGQPLPRAPITPFKGTATLSPFVVLATRA